MPAMIVTEKVQRRKPFAMIGMQQCVDAVHRRLHRQMRADHPLQHPGDKLRRLARLPSGSHTVADRTDRHRPAAKHRAGIPTALRLRFHRIQPGFQPGRSRGGQLQTAAAVKDPVALKTDNLQIHVHNLLDQRHDHLLQIRPAQFGEIQNNLQRAVIPGLYLNPANLKMIAFQQVHQFFSKRFLICRALLHLHRRGFQRLRHSIKKTRLCRPGFPDIIGDQIKDARKLRQLMQQRPPPVFHPYTFKRKVFFVHPARPDAACRQHLHQQKRDEPRTQRLPGKLCPDRRHQPYAQPDPDRLLPQRAH